MTTATPAPVAVPTWAELKKRSERRRGGDAELAKNGERYRGPISEIVIDGDVACIHLRRCAHWNGERWVRRDTVERFYIRKRGEPEDAGNEQIRFLLRGGADHILIYPRSQRLSFAKNVRA